MFSFILQPVSKIFLILRRIQRDTVINVKMSLCKLRVIHSRISMKLEFSRQIFEKAQNIKFHQNPSSGNRVVACGRIDRRKEGHDEAFRNFVNAPEMTH